MMLTWAAPRFTGGRNDTVYRIECDACDPSASFVPSRQGLNETRVLISGLSPLTTHRFLVYAENGASGHDASQFSDISFTTSAFTTAAVASSAPSYPRPSPPAPSSSSTGGSVTQVMSEDGSPLKYKEVDVPLLPKSRSRTQYGMMAGMIVASLALLFIVIVAIIFYVKRSHDECSKKQPSDCDTLEYTQADRERHPITGSVLDHHPPLVPTPRFNAHFSSPYSTPIFTHYSASPSYVETHTYEDPNQILPLTLKRSTLKPSLGMGNMTLGAHNNDRMPCDFAIHTHDHLHDRFHNISRTLNSRTSMRGKTDL